MCDLRLARSAWARRNRFVPPPVIFPHDIETLKAMVIAAQAARVEAEAKALNMEAEVRARELLIEQMKFTIKKAQARAVGPILKEPHAVLEQLEAPASRDGGGRLASGGRGTARSECGSARQYQRRQPVSGASLRAGRCPEHLPRERIVYPSPSACPCCGGSLQ